MVDVKALEMKGISKSFGGVHALTNVHYNAYRGKVNVLMGEKPELRKAFIEQNAKLVTDLDV